MRVADVKIRVTLGNHDSKGLDSEEGRRLGCYERTLDNVVMINMEMSHSRERLCTKVEVWKCKVLMIKERIKVERCKKDGGGGSLYPSQQRPGSQCAHFRFWGSGLRKLFIHFRFGAMNEN